MKYSVKIPNGCVLGYQVSVRKSVTEFKTQPRNRKLPQQQFLSSLPIVDTLSFNRVASISTNKSKRILGDHVAAISNGWTRTASNGFFSFGSPLATTTTKHQSSHNDIIQSICESYQDRQN